MANEKWLIDPNEFLDRLNKASYDVITYPDREMDSPQFGYYTDTIQAVLNQTKKVDAVEVVHARWEYIPIIDSLGRYRCERCFHYVDAGTDRNYCPNCGAKMDGDGNG